MAYTELSNTFRVKKTLVHCSSSKWPQVRWKLASPAGWFQESREANIVPEDKAELSNDGLKWVANNHDSVCSWLRALMILTERFRDRGLRACP